MKPDSQPFRGLVGGTVHTRENPSDFDVEIPPARLITDSMGGMWSLGTEFISGKNGWLEFNVLRNDVDTNETAMKIVYKKGRVAIFGRYGWKYWNDKTFV